MEPSELRRHFMLGASFREAFDAACHGDAAHAREAYELWAAWEAESAPVVDLRKMKMFTAIHDQMRWARMPHPLGACGPAVCWKIRDTWADVSPGLWCRDGRSLWLVPGTYEGESA